MKTIQHKFVEFIPNFPETGFLYVSMEYRTAVHLCVCGCGNKVVTPLSPTDWKLSFDGRSISLFPSIGNWSFPCKSHYFITNGQIKHSYHWSERDDKNGQEANKRRKKLFFGKFKPN